MIDNEQFRQCLQMLRSKLTLMHRIKLTDMIFSEYDDVCAKIKNDLKDVRQIFIALNAWFSFQKVAYLKVLMYWVDVIFQHREHLIDFTSLQLEHTDRHLMQELFKILNTYNIKNKLLDVVINNASNNDTLKKKFKKAFNWWDIS